MELGLVVVRRALAPARRRPSSCSKPMFAWAQDTGRSFCQGAEDVEGCMSLVEKKRLEALRKFGVVSGSPRTSTSSDLGGGCTTNTLDCSSKEASTSRSSASGVSSKRSNKAETAEGSSEKTDDAGRGAEQHEHGKDVKDATVDGQDYNEIWADYVWYMDHQRTHGWKT